MKKFGLLLLSMFSVMTMKSQPRPFEPDPTFVPTLEFMQKSWTGVYDGLEPNSRMILSLSRTLVLNADLTYKNEVKGQVKNQSEEVLLRFETGTYQYGPDNRFVTYSIDVDSTLDINILLKGEEQSYAVNHYKEEGREKTSTEEVLFTRSATDYDRRWILFDQQLMSPIDPRQRAVYAMTGTAILPSGILGVPSVSKSKINAVYDLKGRRVTKPTNGVYISNKRKVLVKRE